MEQTKYPVTVQLTGRDGNAFAVMGAVSKALKESGVPQMEVTEWLKEAMQSPSYDALLMFVMETVEVE
jgi:hypothetical protein